MIAILDYGSGNLRSAQRAFETSGREVVITSDYQVALNADGLVVPGVGAFAACMNGLNAVDGAAIVRERLAKERPTLGICIGMQILFSQGTEHSESAAHAGVGIWDGIISKLDAPILPHMGWNTVYFKKDSAMNTGVSTNPRYYFVHSYFVDCANQDDILCTTQYGQEFVSGFQTLLCQWRSHLLTFSGLWESIKRSAYKNV